MKRIDFCENSLLVSVRANTKLHERQHRSETERRVATSGNACPHPALNRLATPRNMREAATFVTYTHNRHYDQRFTLLTSFIYSTIARNFTRECMEFCIFSRSTWIYALVIYIFLCI